MEVDYGLLRVSQTILIKRSSGRVHEALISAVDPRSPFVSVEWTENGETKGKEVELKDVVAMNKELFQKGPVTRSSSRRTISTPSSKQPRVGLKAVENVAVANIPKVQHQQKVSSIPTRARQNAQNAPPSVSAPVGKRPGIQPGNLRERREEEEVAEVRQFGAKEEAVRQSSTEEEEETEERKEFATPKEKPAPDAIPAPPHVQAVPLSREKPPAAVSKGRKSTCVKEVERLKKNRDERRARAAGKMAQRHEEYDTSHPQWEFLNKIREYRAKTEFRPLVGDEPVVSSRICVCVRKRPLNKRELTRQDIDVISVPGKSGITVHEPKVKVDLTKLVENQPFCFDYVFDQGVGNEVVYRYTAQPLVKTIFDRGMATCFAYGQTGSGKTHTMGGTFTGKEQDAAKGIYALAAADVFRLNAEPGHRAKELAVSASFFEIHNGNVYDLLGRKRRLRILEDGRQQVQVVGLVEEAVKSVADVLSLIRVGNTCRTSGTTSANQHSSRSHAVFQIILRKRSAQKLYGKFSLIDLAGNERGADTASSDRQTRMEGAEINKSLLALKECIRALGRKGAHLPFRGSKLTQVLKDSFVGDNSRTCMIAMISPGFSSCEHTLNTLRYADRVKELRSNKGGGAVESVSPPEEVFGGGLMQPPASPLHVDLQYLHHTLQQESGLDRSVELLTFHEAVGEVVESEEQLVQEHRDIIQEDRALLEKEEQLLEYVNTVDHDIDRYVAEIEKIVSIKLSRLSQFRERIQDLHQRLNEEESASKMIGRRPPVF